MTVPCSLYIVSPQTFLTVAQMSFSNTESKTEHTDVSSVRLKGLASVLGERLDEGRDCGGRTLCEEPGGAVQADVKLEQQYTEC